MTASRIVVTGIGASSPIGGTAPESWSALLAGASGTRTLEYDWVEENQLPVTFAAQAAVRPETVLERPMARRLDPASQFAMVAAMEAWADAGAPEVDLYSRLEARAADAAQHEIGNVLGCGDRELGDVRRLRLGRGECVI